MTLGALVGRQIGSVVGRQIGALSTVTYETETNTLLAAMTTQPSATRATQINTLVKGLKDAGIWAKLDMLQVYAAHDSQAARVDWKLPSRVATMVNSPTFTTDRGFNGDGATSYVDSGFNLLGATNFTQNSACAGGWRRTSTGSTNAWLSPINGSRTQLSVQASQTGHRITTNAAVDNITRSPTAGFYVANRSATSATQLYLNGSSIGTGTTTSASILSGNLGIGFTGSVYSADQIACILAGTSLTADEHTSLYNLINAYMTAVGAA